MTEWPADRVERRPIADLIPYARNARTHSAEQVEQIAASIREWGWTVPVLVDEAGGIIAGHGRVLAAQKLGVTDIPVMVTTGWSETQKRAYVIADNKLTLNAGWDNELLVSELTDICAATDFNAALTGFSAEELATMFGERPPPASLSSAPGLGDGLAFQVVVVCRDETDQAMLLERLKSEGRECRPLIL